MSSGCSARREPNGAPSSEKAVVPLFVCGGARDVESKVAVFPYGGTFDELVPCPARDICAWHAAHDFGGDDFHFGDQPKERVLPSAFTSGPFTCPHFHDYAKIMGSRRLPSVEPMVAALHIRREPRTARNVS